MASTPSPGPPKRTPGAKRRDTDISRQLKGASLHNAKALETRPGTLTIATIGGVADIGMNWTLYGYEDAYVLVDAGTTFPPRETVGIEAVMPDPAIFEWLGDRLKALLVTHFHEDHVGAIHRFWPKYAKCPIHAPPFATRMLNGRFQEAGTRGRVSLNSFEPGSNLKLAGMKIRTVRVAHSTPDCVGLAIETPAGRVVHTGDWKIDADPGIGSRTNMGAFADLGRAGVDLMLCDSTNADREAPRTSEAQVQRALMRLMATTRGMVIVSSFGSNVARMASVAKAAKANRRKVALAGRSLTTAAEAAEHLGLMKGVPELIKDPAKFNGTDRRSCAMIVTGTQGEENAALARMAHGTDARLPKVGRGDVIVHSARAIPGNEEYIFAILGKLADQGARIVTADDLVEGDPVHVTGHPVRADLREMYAAVKPRLALPVHGTPMHLAAHAALARELGAQAPMVPHDGGVYHLKDGALTHAASLAIAHVGVLQDGQASLVPWDMATQSAVLSAEEAQALEAQRKREADRLERRRERDRRGTGRGPQPHRGHEGRERGRHARPGKPERHGHQGRDKRGPKGENGAEAWTAGGDRAEAFEVVRVQKGVPHRVGPRHPLALDRSFIDQLGAR